MEDHGVKDHGPLSDEAVAYLEGLPKSSRAKQLFENQVLAARHFAHRFDTFLQWLQDTQALGKVQHHFWRVEFQMRGSLRMP